jgi:outer membrane protein OmpA-like peptidoglycan-associated protein
MIVYLKKLFERKPDSRVIFFSQVSIFFGLLNLLTNDIKFEDTLTNVSQILTDYQIPNVFVEGYAQNFDSSFSLIHSRR